ncbi:hypothetical protein ILYODFUR_010880 [Ilyodon furcidens]|uniref:Uncharacterized protein n=1 Tax=Ilyodon furcidens TaxID=33524 RepID=A0ABV0T715_9TELE
MLKPNRKESAEVASASGQDASRVPPFEDFLKMSPGLNQNSLEAPYIPLLALERFKTPWGFVTPTTRYQRSGRQWLDRSTEVVVCFGISNDL